MCILAIAWQAHPRWRLVVAANRDEFHDRAAAPLARWPDRDLIAGRDLRAGGTWLGVSAQGHFAAITNLRGFGGPDAALASRGALVADLASGSGPWHDPAAADLGRFNPFNAIAVSPSGARFLANRPAPVHRTLAPGLHAMSNGPLDPPWRKSLRLSALIEQWLAAPHPAPHALLGDLRDPAPPVGSADDPAAIFIDDPVYGTRCSTVVAVDDAGVGVIVERRYDRSGQASSDTKIGFRW